MISIKGLSKAQVLLSLYNNSKAQGMSFLGLPKDPVNLRDCEEALEYYQYFDYWCGKVIKVDLSGDEFNPALYDRDNGYGAAEEAVNAVRLLASN